MRSHPRVNVRLNCYELPPKVVIEAVLILVRAKPDWGVEDSCRPFRALTKAVSGDLPFVQRAPQQLVGAL